MIKRAPLELIFTPQGTAELCRADSVLWASDEDDDFREECIADEMLEPERDSETILDYLVSIDKLTDDQARGVEIISEVYDEDGDDDSGEVFEGEIVGPDD